MSPRDSAPASDEALDRLIDRLEHVGWLVTNTVGGGMEIFFQHLPPDIDPDAARPVYALIGVDE